jgi:Rod binding domain-containing protein
MTSISSIVSNAPAPVLTPSASPKPPDAEAKDEKLRAAFEDFVGQTLFGQTLKSMRKTQHKPAYFHGGRGEEIFQQQLDQVLAEKLSRASAEKLAGPMYELFTMSRR